MGLLLSYAIARSSREGHISIWMPFGGVGRREPLRIKLVRVWEEIGVPMKEKAGHDNVGIDRDDMAIDGKLFTYIQKKNTH